MRGNFIFKGLLLGDRDVEIYLKRNSLEISIWQESKMQKEMFYPIVMIKKVEMILAGHEKGYAIEINSEPVITSFKKPGDAAMVYRGITRYIYAVTSEELFGTYRITDQLKGDMVKVYEWGFREIGDDAERGHNGR